MTDTAFDTPLGASAWEQDLLRHLHDHVIREGALLEEYAYIAENSRSKALRYVMGILLEDEQRHHRWFQELASSLQTAGSLSGAPTPIPHLDIGMFDETAVRALMERLSESEKDDARELDRLRRELRDVADTTLWALLVDLMRRDTEKHLEILSFLEDHCRPLSG